MKLKEFEKGILITSSAAAGDGGSLFFECQTKNGEKFQLMFTQHVFLDYLDKEMLPGRIYLNQKPVELKSEEERLILKGVSNFSITSELWDNDNKLDKTLTKTFKKITEFYNSDQAIKIKEKVDRNLKKQ